MAALRRYRRLRSQRGAELVEFALTFPLLLLVVLGIMDFGFLFQQYEVVTNAAREGARIAVLPGYSAADVEARVEQYLATGGLSRTPTTTVLPPAAVSIGGACMTLTSVTVAYPHRYMFLEGIVAYMGGTGFADKTLTATATMRYEGGSMSC
jgi:Flp pilus assembly protein TadG